MIFGVSEKCTLPLPRDLLIHAARMRARGLSWQTIARGTDFTALDLARLPFDNPEIWEPLYKRAEKLQLQETEGEGLKALMVLLEDQDEIAAEQAARELLVHRRHIAHDRRPRPDRARAPDPRPEPEVEPYPQALMEEPAPPELRASIIHLACCRAQGEDPLSTAAEIGRDHEEVARWPFIYPQTWDRHWPTARLETARFYAARALKTLTSLAFGPDRKLAARAARTLLVHRRHMHWNRENQPPRRQEGQEGPKSSAEVPAGTARENPRGPDSLGALAVQSLSVPWRLGGEKDCRIRDGPGA